MFPAQYTINNNAAVPQTWTRVALSANYAKYVNDTARALGHEEWFELRATPEIPKKVSSTVSAVAQKWNLKIYTKQSTDSIPHIDNFTTELDKLLGNAVSVARNRYKDHRNVFVAITDTDAEIDDVTGCRVM